MVSRLQDYIELENLDGVVLSHYHWDHMADIGCLQYAARVLMDLGQRRKPLDIYGHACSRHLEEMDYLTFSKGHEIAAGTTLQLASLQFTFAENFHPDPCLSMRIETTSSTLVYITDTGWTESLVEMAADADLLLCEASLYDEYIGRIPGHLTAGEAGRIAAEAGAKHLVLTHLPHFGDHRLLAQQARNKFGGPVELAAAGKTWDI